MSAFETATAFFHACEGLQGWEGCKQYVAENAVFSAQSEPLVDIQLVEGYCEWMAGLGKGPLVGCGYSIHSSAWDEANRTALYFATFNGEHSGEGGPVPATGGVTHSHYVYAITMDDDDKVCAMTKVWNAPWALKELGWM
ncbi:hypothetical protein EYC87_05205 [Halieaceae bacterium IMCC8485]|jgi:hypothetical protein|uniref:SnoaL-like domain-containing protein n=1 Tax=Candidatus Seongchinamella marina TaxID=2518990 RepID=A0ABT3SSM3_9GAMM|nr:hypothetical protein [Candidatus Seongchinamella marina]MCX2972982.1 hypothetical protein [Candidatus Seongchinamella marina]